MTITENRAETPARVVSPTDVELARTILAEVTAEMRRRAGLVDVEAAIEPFLHVVVDEASMVLRDLRCRDLVDDLARMGGRGRLRLVLRDVFPAPRPGDEPGYIPAGRLGSSMLIQDAVEASLFEVERVPLGEFVPLAVEPRSEAPSTCVDDLLAAMYGCEPLTGPELLTHMCASLDRDVSSILSNTINAAVLCGWVAQGATTGRRRYVLTASGVEYCKARTGAGS